MATAVPLRVVQVGLGPWGRDWAARVLPNPDGIEVVGVVDCDPAALETARRDQLLEPTAPTFTELAQALQVVKADVVLVTAAITAHAQLVMTALDRGCHVLVEKPFVLEMCEAETAVALAARRRLTLAVGQNYRYNPQVALIRRFIGEGTLGAVTGVSLDFGRYYPYDPAASTNPGVDHAILPQMAIHHFDLMRYLLGREARAVFCRDWSDDGSAPPSAASAVIDFGDDVIVTYRARMLAAGEETPWTGVWRIECAKGEIGWAPTESSSGHMFFEKNPDLAGYVTTKPHGANAERRHVLRAAVDSRVLLLEEFVHAVTQGVDISVSGRDNLGTLALLAAARESARSGAVVPVVIPAMMSAVPRGTPKPAFDRGALVGPHGVRYTRPAIGNTRPVRWGMG